MARCWINLDWSRIDIFLISLFIQLLRLFSCYHRIGSAVFIWKSITEFNHRGNTTCWNSSRQEPRTKPFILITLILLKTNINFFCFDPALLKMNSGLQSHGASSACFLTDDKWRVDWCSSYSNLSTLGSGCYEVRPLLSTTIFWSASLIQRKCFPCSSSALSCTALSCRSTGAATNVFQRVKRSSSAKPPAMLCTGGALSARSALMCVASRWVPLSNSMKTVLTLGGHA